MLIYNSCGTSSEGALENSCLISNYIKGWGRVSNEDCFTDDFGPNRHDKCRKPFYYEGKLYEGCQKTIESPSSKNRRCQQLEQEKGNSSMPTEGDSLMIKYNRGRRATVCYNKEGRVDQKCLILELVLKAFTNSWKKWLVWRVFEKCRHVVLWLLPLW